jgi:hypothetical protein
MTAVARIATLFGIGLIVLLAVTGEWYYGVLAFFALTIVVPAAWTSGNR